MSNRRLKPVAAAIGTAMAASLASAAFADVGGETFVADELDAGYMLLAQAEPEGKCGEGACGEAATAASDDAKDAEGQCGEAEASADKSAEGKCGEGKCGEGQCGAA